MVVRQPPRAIGAGDVAAAHAERLGEWTAAQIIGVDAATLHAQLAQPGPDPQIRHLTVFGIKNLDCARLAARFPELTQLRMWGPGTLTGAVHLNTLRSLTAFQAKDLFGMGAAWTPEIPNGTDPSIKAARPPAWIAENVDNPLRDWDGADLIPAGEGLDNVRDW